jgi:hypothetical protein
MANISNSVGGDNFGDVVQAGHDANVTKVSGSSADVLDLLVALKQLRASVDGLDAPANLRDAAAHAVGEVEQELRAPTPDRQNVAGSLERLTELLKKGGALASAGAALVDPIGKIAQWLGPLGTSVLAAL